MTKWDEPAKDAGRQADGHNPNVSQDDLGEWRTFLHEHYERVYAYAYMSTFDREAAESVASAVFEAAARSSERVRRPAGSSWLFRLADEQCARYALSDANGHAPRDGASTGEGLLRSPAQLAADLSSVLRRLKPDERDALMLRIVEGRPVADAAREAGASAASFRRRHLKALTSLSERLAS